MHFFSSMSTRPFPGPASFCLVSQKITSLISLQNITVKQIRRKKKKKEKKRLLIFISKKTKPER